MRPAALLALLALAVASILLLLGGEPEEPADPPVETAPTTVADAAPAEPPAEGLRDSSRAAEPETTEPTEVERTALLDEATVAEVEFEGEPLAVRVIDVSGRLVSDAEVILLDRDRYDRKAFRAAEDSLANAGERVELLRRFGVVGRTGNGGLAHFQWGARRAEVFVATDFGLERAVVTRSRVEGGRLDVQIELPPMAIEFLEPDGRPVVGLACRVLSREFRDLSVPMFSGANPFVDVDPAEITNERGRAYPTGVGALLEIEGERAFRSASLLADLVAREPLDVPKLEALGPDLPVTVVVPPLAPLEVEVVRPDGTPVADGTFFTLLAAGERGSGLSPDQGSMCVRRVVGGRAVFKHVEVDQPLVLALISNDQARKAVEYLEPLVLGSEPRRVQVVAPTDRALRFQLVDPAGAPLGKTEVGLEFFGGVLKTLADPKPGQEATVSRPYSVQLEAETDAQGRLTLSVPTEFVDGERSDGNFGLRLEVGRDGNRARAEIDPPKPLAMGVNDLGRVVLEPLPLIAAGTVVGQDGQPLSRVRLDVLGALADVSENVPLFPEEDDEVFEFSELPEGGFRPTSTQTVLHLSGRADRDGRFVIRGVAEDDTLSLQPHEDDLFLTEPFDFRVGSDDLVVPMVAAGWIEVRVVHRDVPNIRQLVLAQVEESGYPPRWIGSDGRWKSPQLAPGEHSLTIRMQHSREVLVQVDGIQVPPGMAAQDPRLDPLDLTGRVKTVELRVEGPDGEPLKDWRLLRQGPRFGGSPTYSGTAQVILEAGGELNAAVWSHGYVPQVLRGVSSDQVLRLEAAYPVELELTGASSTLDPSSLLVSVVLELSDEDEPDDLLRSAFLLSRYISLGEDFRAKLTLPRPGRYRVRVRHREMGIGASRDYEYPQFLFRPGDELIQVEIPAEVNAY